MNAQEKILARLYIQSNAVRFGEFKISAHELDDTLPLTPMYLHYPKDSEPGAELLPLMFDIIGKLFYEIITSQKIRFDKVAGIPEGANPFARTTASHFDNPGMILLNFEKRLGDSGKRTFFGPIKGRIGKGDNVVILDDHTSGGYNKSLFVDVIQKNGGEVTDVLTVVDREQGATEFLKNLGITLHSIFTISELLDFYIAESLITSDQYSEIMKYIKDNQIKV